MENLNNEDVVELYGNDTDIMIIPASNKKILEQFEERVKKYVETEKNNKFSDLDFYILFNGVSDAGGATKIHTGELRYYLEIFIEDQIKNHVAKDEVKDIINNIYKARRKEIISIKLEDYTDYVIAKTFDYAEELNIKEILLENREEVLKMFSLLDIFDNVVGHNKFISNNYEKIVDILCKYIKEYPLQISREQEKKWDFLNPYDTRIEKLLDFLGNCLLELKNLEIAVNMECVPEIENIIDNLEKMAKDVLNGKIKDINSFELKDYI